jgi:hypothetical protein
VETRIEAERVRSSGCQEMHEGLPSLTKQQTAPTARCVALRPRSQRLAERPLRRRFGGTIGGPLAYPLIRAWDSRGPERIPGLRQDGPGSRVGLAPRRDFAGVGASIGQALVAKCSGRRLVAEEKTPQTSRGRLRQMFIASQVAKSLIVWEGAELPLDCSRELYGAAPRVACWGCRLGRASKGEYRYYDCLPQPASLEHTGVSLAWLTNSPFPATQGWES